MSIIDSHTTTHSVNISKRVIKNNINNFPTLMVEHGLHKYRHALRTDKKRSMSGTYVITSPTQYFYFYRNTEQLAHQ